MNKQKLLDELAKLASCLEDFKGTTGYCDGKYAAYEIAIELAKQLDEPQAEKVAVPDYLANYIEAEKCRDSESIDEVFSPGFVNEWDEVNKWLYDNPTEENERRYLMAIRAYVDGYTVEQPKRWVVKLPNNYYFSSWISLYSLEADGAAYKFYDDVFVFDDHTKAGAVATLVDGSVEEV